MIQLTKTKENSVVGLEIESGSIAAAEVRTNGASHMTGSAIAPLAPELFQDGEVTDPDGLGDALRDFFGENKLSRRVRLGIANQGVIVRTIRLPAIDDPKELASAVRFQAQEQFPMPLEQAVIDYRVVGGVAMSEETAPQIDVIVVAARSDMVHALLEPLRRARLQPIGVDLSAFGMIRALAGNETNTPAVDSNGQATTQPSATLFCHVGSITNLAVAKGRACLFTRVSPVGLEVIASKLAAGSGLTEEHARQWLAHVGLDQPVEGIEGDPETVASARRALEQGASSLLDDLRLSLDYYRAQEGSVPVDRVVLCGPGSTIAGLDRHMHSVLELPFEIGRPDALANLDVDSAARLTLPYGLALEA